MTELSSLGSSDGLFKQVPEFLLVDDESSTYPLLTPSPPAEFEHPLALDTPPVVAYERQLSPSSIDTDLSSIPTLSAAPSADYGALGNSRPPPSDKQPQQGKLSEAHSGMGSSSSSSSVLQDTTASAQLLNSHHYLGLASDANRQENGGINGGLCGMTLGSIKNPQDYFFLSWNWPLIRKFCFWGMMSLTVAFVCVIIGFITTLPSRCDPPRAWYQGSVIYEIFPGSFHDTNMDGVGDFKGIIGKVSYLESLGIRGIRLNSIFPSNHYPERYNDVDNLTQIQQSLGSFDDFQRLVQTLHEKNISVILDLPLESFFKRYEDSRKINLVSHSHHMIINNHILNTINNKTKDTEPHILVPDILDFWLNHGVDGFYLKGIEGMVDDESFQQQVREWKSVLKRHRHGFEKILVCSEKLIHTMENSQLLSDKLATVMTHFDLVEYEVQMSGGLKAQLDGVQGGVLLSRPGYPWPMWSLGSVDTPRLASRLAAPNASLAAVLVSIMLPGTPSIFYGDEIGLENLPDKEKHFDDISHLHQLVMMQWESAPRRHAGVLGWLPRAKAHLPLDSVRLISEGAALRDSSPTIYMHSVWRDSTLLPNTAVKYMDETLIVLERLYPRRHSYVIVANLGRQMETRDLSRLFYGGHVELSIGHHERNKYLTFHKLVLFPGEAVVVRLDK